MKLPLSTRSELSAEAWGVDPVPEPETLQKAKNSAGEEQNEHYVYEDIYGLHKAEQEQARLEASPLYQAQKRRREEREGNNGLLILGGIILLAILFGIAQNQGQNSAQRANEAYIEDYE